MNLSCLSYLVSYPYLSRNLLRNRMITKEVFFHAERILSFTGKGRGGVSGYQRIHVLAVGSAGTDKQRHKAFRPLYRLAA